MGGKRRREEEAGRKHDEPRDGTSSESHNICLLASCPVAAVGGGAWRGVAVSRAAVADNASITRQCSDYCYAPQPPTKKSCRDSELHLKATSGAISASCSDRWRAGKRWAGIGRGVSARMGDKLFEYRSSTPLRSHTSGRPTVSPLARGSDRMSIPRDWARHGFAAFRAAIPVRAEPLFTVFRAAKARAG